MDNWFFITLLFGLQVIYYFVGRQSSTKMEGKEDYFLAGKKVRVFPLMMTFLATQVGGGIILGTADEAYTHGWPVILYPLGCSIGLILLGLGFGKRLAAFPVSTIAQIFEVVYKSSLLKKIASILSIISLFMILVAQIIASYKFLLCIGFTSIPLFILFWAIVILYTAQGGLKAVISTDIVQAAFFSFVFLGAFTYVLSTQPLPSFPTPDLTALSPKLIGWLLMPLCFMLIEQDMGQRCFAASSPRTVSRASLLAGIATLIICVVPIFFGALAQSLNLPIPPNASVLMIAISSTTNPYLTAFVSCAILAAIISTATSLINAIGSNLSNDFPLRPSVRAARTITSLISCSAIVFAFFFTNVVDLLIQSYELSVSCLFIPILFALFNRKAPLAAAALSLSFGALAFFYSRLLPIPIPKELFGLTASLLGYAAGYLYARTRQTLAA